MVAPTDFVRTVCDKLRFSVEIEKLVFLCIGSSGTSTPTIRWFDFDNI